MKTKERDYLKHQEVMRVVRNARGEINKFLNEVERANIPEEEKERFRKQFAPLLAEVDSV